MWVFSFYRFYISVLCGVSVYLLLIKNIWISILAAFITRTVWYFFERFIKRYTIQRDYNRHIPEFKQQNGPYGIRIANKADKEWRIKESLAEVFTSNIKQLKKTVDQLEMMDTLFKAGMRPEGDEYLLHDLKLKYGKYRLQESDSHNP